MSLKAKSIILFVSFREFSIENLDLAKQLSNHRRVPPQAATCTLIASSLQLQNQWTRIWCWTAMDRLRCPRCQHRDELELNSIRCTFRLASEIRTLCQRFNDQVQGPQAVQPLPLISAGADAKPFNEVFIHGFLSVTNEINRILKSTSYRTKCTGWWENFHRFTKSADRMMDFLNRQSSPESRGNFLVERVILKISW